MLGRTYYLLTYIGAETGKSQKDEDPLVALFRKKPAAENNDDVEPTEVVFEPQPEKAKKFFDFAKAAADSFNFDYSLRCYADGLKLDPSTMSAHDAMFETAVKFMNKGGKGASGKEIRDLDDGTDIGKFVAAEFAWMKDLKNPKLALKALEAACRAEQMEWGHASATRIFNLLQRQKKQNKSLLVQALVLFQKVEAFDEAIAVGQTARELDPADNELANTLNDLSVQRAMHEGGYEAAAGKEGGFREMVRDIDKQRELEESDALTSSQSVDERNLSRAREDYEQNPTIPDVLNKYAQLLKKQGTPETAQQACDIYEKGYTDTKQYRFRMLAGNIKIEQFERKIEALEEQALDKPLDDTQQSELDSLKQPLLDLKVKEYTERVKEYPTDRYRKYDLGMVQFQLEKYEDSMAQFQNAKDEPKLRVRAGHMLGRCFAEEGWHMEAIAEYEEAIDSIDATQKEHELHIRYDLMVSLIAHARDEQSVELAKQALDICSSIARKNITYRDIRDRRKEIDSLVKELSGTTPS